MIEAIIPTIDEMNFRQSLLSHEKTMSYNQKWGGTILFPESKWSEWYNVWVVGDEYKHYYRYLYSPPLNAFVGEIAYHYSEQYNAHMTSIIIKAEYRGHGFGLEGLSLLIQAAADRGVVTLCDTIAIDNGSVKLFKKLGFVEKWRNDECIMVEKRL